jgi:hypothetical protein
MGNRSRTLVCALLSLVTAVMSMACAAESGVDLAAKHNRATIAPSIVHLQPGEPRKFKVVLAATRLMAAREPNRVQWAVDDVPGGNDVVGRISAEGLYRAPKVTPSPREIHICATVPEAANRRLFATVIIGAGEPRYRSVRIWTQPIVDKPNDEGKFVDPHGIALDKSGNLLIADQLGSAVWRVSQEGKLLQRIDAGRGSEPGQVTEPRIIAVSAKGLIYISDSKGDRPRVQVFSPEGKFQRIFAEKGRQPGMLLRCHGLSFDPSGRLFSTDVDNMRVSVYTGRGKHLYDWGDEGLNPGQLNAPHGLYVDPSGDVFITCYYGPTQKFDDVGNFVTAFGYGDPPDGPVFFHNMTGDRWGNVYLMVRTIHGYQGAAETGGPRRMSIAKYNNNGDFITAWAFTAAKHSETTCTIDQQGRVYALLKGGGEMGVETFEEE